MILGCLFGHTLKLRDPKLDHMTRSVKHKAKRAAPLIYKSLSCLYLGTAASFNYPFYFYICGKTRKKRKRIGVSSYLYLETCVVLPVGSGYSSNISALNHKVKIGFALLASNLSLGNGVQFVLSPELWQSEAVYSYEKGNASCWDYWRAAVSFKWRNRVTCTRNVIQPATGIRVELQLNKAHGLFSIKSRTETSAVVARGTMVKDCFDCKPFDRFQPDPQKTNERTDLPR